MGYFFVPKEVNLIVFEVLGFVNLFLLVPSEFSITAA